MDKLAIIEVDRVLVKGKKEAETVYTILGGGELLQQEPFTRFQSTFHSMIFHYRAGHWPHALQDLERCREMNMAGMSKLLSVYSARIKGFLITPPASDWDGVYKAWVPAA